MDILTVLQIINLFVMLITAVLSVYHYDSLFLKIIWLLSIIVWLLLASIRWCN